MLLALDNYMLSALDNACFMHWIIYIINIGYCTLSALDIVVVHYWHYKVTRENEYDVER